MNTSFLFAIVAALLFVGDSPTGEKEQPAAKKQLRFNLRICEGDPEGNSEAGTLKTFQPTITTLEGRAALVRQGGKVPILHGDEIEWVHTGSQLTVKPGKVQDAKVDVDIEFELVNQDSFTEDRIQISKTSTRLITKVKLGETVKIESVKKTGKDQRWAELVVEEVKPEDK